MGTIFLRSDSEKWGQGLKWGQSESRDNMLLLPLKVFKSRTSALTGMRLALFRILPAEQNSK